MFLCDQWRDYEVLDTGDGEKLERWGDIVLRRPDPQVIWPKADPALWDAAQATYVRSDTGGGHWEFREKLPDRWVIGLNNLKFYVKPTGFKHTGLFPEQAANWAFMQERIRAAGAWGRPPRVLNLFAYTGGATLACAAAGAHAAAYLRTGAQDAPALPVRAENGVRYTVPAAVRPACAGDAVTLRFRVGGVYRNRTVAVYAGDACLVRRKRPVLAPGEMETLRLPGEKLRAAARAGAADITVTLEEG